MPYEFKYGKSIHTDAPYDFPNIYLLLGFQRQRTNSSSRSDDEVETSLSDELNVSWPAVSSRKSKIKKGRSSSSVNQYEINQVREANNNFIPLDIDGIDVDKRNPRRSRRQRERERFGVPKRGGRVGATEYVRSNINGTILGTAAERPKTATLKRPSILDESLKDKVNNPITICSISWVIKHFYLWA